MINLKLTVRSKNIRDIYRNINDIKKGYQLRLITVKDLVMDCHRILVRWRNHFYRLFNVLGVSDVKQREIQTAEPLVAGTRDFEFKKAIEKLNNHKSPGRSNSSRIN